MYKALIGAAALLMATAGQAAVEIDFNNPTGDVGSNTHTYFDASSTYSVTATGYSNFNFATNTGTANDLFGKDLGGDEEGVGLVGDPSTQHEIWFANDGFTTIPAIVVDVSSLLAAGAINGQFEMGSTTLGEQYGVFGFDGSWHFEGFGSADSTFQDLPGFGSFTQYAFISGGTLTGETRTTGNVLLTALSVAVPEPQTWAMMLLGFGAIGFSMRKTRRKTALAQLA
jgi:hypothetical protein